MKIEKDPNLSPGRPVAGSKSDRERHERGRTARRMAPRSAHACWAPAPDRPDPISLLEKQAKDRLPDLLPIRYRRPTSGRTPTSTMGTASWRVRG
jgi:hypothetical protein